MHSCLHCFSATSGFEVLTTLHLPADPMNVTLRTVFFRARNKYVILEEIPQCELRRLHSCRLAFQLPRTNTRGFDEINPSLPLALLCVLHFESKTKHMAQ
mmetsp:Transcript_45781/g.68116  ORF Transcript_45781/g.68116 Transcript_45781/m.68116 type:complete len:100 (-) Transcript_45781:364-663(-)